MKISTYILLLFMMGWNLTAFAQHDQPTYDIAVEYIREHHLEWGLTDADITDMVLDYAYQRSNNGLHMLYLVQRHQGIEVRNGILNLSISAQGKVLYAGKRFIPALASKVNTTLPVLSAATALEKALLTTGMNSVPELRLLSQPDDKHFVFDKTGIARYDMLVQLCYQYQSEGPVRLAWHTEFVLADGSQMRSIRVDAVTGEILENFNKIISCQFEKGTYAHEHETSCYRQYETPVSTMPAEMPQVGSYRVIELPAESPNHGPHVLVANPDDSEASPYGWHDTNGSVGNEYQYTRGNNVHAYLDLNDTGSSSGDEPNGGAGMNFDFPYDGTAEPSTYRPAAVVNLFYMTNMMHDIFWHYGFDESAGNFQQNNYGNGGAGSDYLEAQAQDGALLNDGVHINNANFGTPPEGFNPQMQMYLWDQSGTELLHITAPAAIIGDIATADADFGAAITTTPVTGEAVLADDGTDTPTLACDALINDVDGKIVIIDRGACDFSCKVLNAQQAGAIAVVICNYEDALLGGMAAGSCGTEVTIPSVFIKSGDCATLKAFTGSGLELSLFQQDNTGPFNLDGDMDNGVIGHEYGHGISARLTGGPQNTDCFSPQELELKDAEGWSDFFALAVTAKEGDTGPQKRGMGTYVYKQDTDGQGLRRFPYSTDMSINPVTYDQIIPYSTYETRHARGHIICSMLWDMYWAFVDQYGFDPDIKNGTGGNNIAIQLVIDGLAIQPCYPGFEDARDAILAADIANNGGVNKCLIWDAFARRGVGINAIQGTSDNSRDNTENYESYPLCNESLKIVKEAPANINAGEVVNYSIKVFNHKPVTLTNVTVSDNIADGCTYVAGSATAGGTVNGNVITWELGNMAYLDTLVLAYQVNTDPANVSIPLFYDGFENGDTEWDMEDLEDNGIFNLWEVTTALANTGTHSYFVENIDTTSDIALKFGEFRTAEGNQPVLRFYHKYNTELGADGGIMQISSDEGAHWYDLGDKMFRTPYRGLIQYTTFAIPFQKAYWGNSGAGWKATYIDLTEFTGEEINVRWRFGTDGNTPAQGWFVDDVLLMDMVNYNSEVCATSAEGDNVCAVIKEYGTVVEPDFNIPTLDITESVQIKVYPNPFGNALFVHLAGEGLQQNAQLRLTGIDGREIWSRQVSGIQESTTITIPTDQLAAGIYFVELRSADSVVTQKVVKQ